MFRVLLLLLLGLATHYCESWLVECYIKWWNAFVIILPVHSPCLCLVICMASWLAEVLATLVYCYDITKACNDKLFFSVNQLPVVVSDLSWSCKSFWIQPSSCMIVGYGCRIMTMWTLLLWNWQCVLEILPIMPALCLMLFMVIMP